MTNFSVIYNAFLRQITDDMYMELTKEDTNKLLHELLESFFLRLYNLCKWKPFLSYSFCRLCNLAK